MFSNERLSEGWHVKFNHGRKLNLRVLSIFVMFCLVPIEVKKITNGLAAVCIPGVEKYASSKGLGFYYECKPGDDSPLLKECSKGLVWDRKSMHCKKPVLHPVRQGEEKNRATEEQDESEIFFEPVLGRTVSLGDLYDARRDLPLNGFSLWNENMIKEKKLTRNKLYSNTHFFYDKSQNDRFALFSIDASLKLSFLGGLIEVEGSAHYLKDQKETENHISFNMMYEATTKTETLPMSLRQNLTYPDICGKFSKNSESGPTHVISSVEYGMKAVFKFEKYVKINESKEEIGGHLKVVVKSIPSFQIEGQAEIHVNGAFKEVRETMDVKMFGDFIVDHSPTTFGESTQVYRDLPTYLGDKATNYKESSPVKIMLTPLGKYCTDAHLLVTGISAELMTKTTEIMVDLSQVMLHVRTLESTYLAHKFLDVSTLLKLFRIELDVYTIEIKTQLRDIIPAMRGGGGEEQLPILLKNYIDSPFQYDFALRFMQERERELNTINSLFDDNFIANGAITIGDFTSANVAHALMHKSYVFIYKFSVFSDKKVTEDYLESRKIYTDTWYNNYKSIGLAGYNWREFKSFISINKDSSQDQEFFIQGSALGDKLSQIFVYENGIQLTSDFKVPIAPPKPRIVNKSYKAVTLHIGNTEEIIKNEFITEIMVKYGTELDLQSDYQTVIINTKDYQIWKKGKAIRCYKPCGKKGGPCEKTCGKRGYCCRKGYHNCPDGAQKIAPAFYSCVVNTADTNGKIISTIEIPLEVKNVPITHTFKTIFQTPFGRGKDSEPLTGVQPLASSPPNLEPIDRITSTSAEIKWKKPDVIFGSLTLSGYKVTVDNSKWKEIKTSDMEMTITDLQPATKYIIYLQPWFNDWKIVGDIAEADFYTIPSQPKLEPADKINSTSAELKWQKPDFSGQLTLSGYKVTVDSSKWKKIKTSNVEMTITNLEPATKYTVYLEAWFDDWKIVGDIAEVDFSTIPSQPKLEPVENIKSTSAKLKWKNPDFSGQLTISGYKVTVDNSKWKKIKTSNMEMTITDLQPATKYMVSLQVWFNDWTIVGDIAVADFYTIPSQPILEPADNINSTSAELKWQKPDFSGHLTLSGYKVTVDLSKWKKIKTSNVEMTITNLEPATKYTVYLEAWFDDWKIVGDIAEVDFYTIPSQPNLEPIEHKSSTSVELKWQKPDVILGHFTLSGYKVTMDVSNGKVIKTNNLEIAITNLEPATEYTVYLEAWFNDWMIAGDAAKIHFYTIPSKPGKPSAVKIGKHDVTLQLDKKDNQILAPNAVFNRYNVIFYKVDTNMIEKPGTQYNLNFQNNLIEISSLTQGTKYNFEYKIVTSKGSSLFSPPLLVETHYNKTELDEINDEIDKREDDMRKHITTEINKIDKEISKTEQGIFTHISTEVNKIDKEITKTEQGILTHFKTEVNKIDKEITKTEQGIFEHINKEITKIDKEITKTEQDLSKISNQINDLKLAPLGTIIAWVRRPSTSSNSWANLPYGWQKCDGSVIPNPSIWAGLRTPNLNGEKRFLRGGNDQDMLKFEEDTTKIPDHTHTDNGHTHTATSQADPHSHEYYDDKVTFNDLGFTSMDTHGFYYYNWKTTNDAQRTLKSTVKVSTKVATSKCGLGGVANLGNFAKETKPKNMNVIYIIKIL